MKKPMKHFLLFLTGLTVFGMMSSCKEEGPHKDDIVKFSAVINSQPTVPKAVSTATGTGTFEYNKTTKELSYSINYQGLTPTFVKIEYANPAYERGAPLDVAANPTSNPVTGKFKLNDLQQTYLILGLFYVNIYTNANIYGEIRGQILPNQLD